MKRIFLISAFLSSCLLANSEISTNYTYKDYENSKTKTQGKTLDYRFLHNFENSQITVNYEDSLTKRENEITKAKLTSLEVEKLSMKYLYNISDVLSFKTSFINIEDNLAPTDLIDSYLASYNRTNHSTLLFCLLLQRFYQIGLLYDNWNDENHLFLQEICESNLAKANPESSNAKFPNDLSHNLESTSFLVDLIFVIIRDNLHCFRNVHQSYTNRFVHNHDRNVVSRYLH